MLKTAAWSAPVVALAVATPMSAASTLGLDVDLQAYRYSTGTADMIFTANNPTAAVLRMTVFIPTQFGAGIRVASVTPGSWTADWTADGGYLTRDLPAGSSNNVIYFSCVGPTQASAAVTVTATSPGYPSASPTVVITIP
ncbi:hypothetical protein D1J51_01130 [Leucobacter sp. wl10]|nr:hypothetical protein D1J51_01130 [Leucobacter sp. wl10]